MLAAKWRRCPWSPGRAKSYDPLELFLILPREIIVQGERVQTSWKELTEVPKFLGCLPRYRQLARGLGAPILSFQESLCLHLLQRGSLEHSHEPKHRVHTSRQLRQNLTGWSVCTQREWLRPVIPRVNGDRVTEGSCGVSAPTGPTLKKTSGHRTLRKHLGTEHSQDSCCRGQAIPDHVPKTQDGSPVPVSQALHLHSYPAGYTGALPGLCELDGDLGDQDIDAKYGHSGHGIFNVIIKCDINVMGQCSCPQPESQCMTWVVM